MTKVDVEKVALQCIVPKVSRGLAENSARHAIRSHIAEWDKRSSSATQVLLPATYILAYHDVVIVAVSNSQDIR